MITDNGVRVLPMFSKSGTAHALRMRGIDIIGWTSSFILLATLIQQVYKQWRTGTHSGVSKWLFVGQVTASIGYVA